MATYNSLVANKYIFKKEIEIGGFDPTDATAMRLGTMPVRFVSFDGASHSNQRYLINYEDEGVGFLSAIGTTTSFTGDLTLVLNSAYSRTSASLSALGGAGAFYGVSGTDAEGNTYIGSKNARFGFWTHGPYFYYTSVGSTQYGGYLCTPGGTLKAIIFRSDTKNIDLIETSIEAKRVYISNPASTDSSRYYWNAGLYFDIPKADSDCVLCLQFVPDEITETTPLIVPTLSATGDGYCNFTFTNTENMPIDVIIDNQKYVILPNSSSSIRVTGTNDVQNIKTYYCKSFWKFDSGTSNFSYTPTASTTTEE